MLWDQKRRIESVGLGLWVRWEDLTALGAVQNVARVTVSPDRLICRLR